jgi:hypothetical protein
MGPLARQAAVGRGCWARSGSEVVMRAVARLFERGILDERPDAEGGISTPVTAYADAVSRQS